MVTKLADLDMNKTYSYADYLAWRLDEYVELIKGHIFKMSPAPRRYHQTISGNIFGKMHQTLLKKKCKVYDAPFDVRLPKLGHKMDDQIFTVVQPDICVICDPSKLDDKGCLGAPDLIVEILSPSTTRKDIVDKYDLYAESGVKEYWLVWPEAKTVQIFDLENEVYVERGLYEYEATINARAIDFQITLAEMFED